MAYEPREYPKMKYHAKHGARTVNNAEEEQALGSGWVKHPDELDEQKQQEREQSERDEELARLATTNDALPSATATNAPEFNVPKANEPATVSQTISQRAAKK